MRSRGCQAGANSSPERRASALQVKTLASLFGIRGIGNMACSVKIILDSFLTRASVDALTQGGIHGNPVKPLIAEMNHATQLPFHRIDLTDGRAFIRCNHAPSRGKEGAGRAPYDSMRKNRVTRAMSAKLISPMR